MTLPVKSRIQLLEGLEDKKESVLEMQSVVLRKLGWEYTCKTPGSIWLWKKTITTYRRYREPSMINRGEGLGWVKNPNADGWINETIVYDALCDTNMALLIEERMLNESTEPF